MGVAAILAGAMAMLLAGEAGLMAQQDTLRRRPDSTFTRATDSFPHFTMTRSPTKAVLFSILPGGGQFYNEQYWKIPVFFGAAAIFVGQVIYYNNHFLEKQHQIDTLPSTSLIIDAVKQQREFYRDNRDLSAAYLLGVEILNMVDAYVGANLFDFDVGEDRTAHLYLDPNHYGVGMAVRW